MYNLLDVAAQLAIPALEKKRRSPLGLKPVCSTYLVPGQPGLHSEIPRSSKPPITIKLSLEYIKFMVHIFKVQGVIKCMSVLT